MAYTNFQQLPIWRESVDLAGELFHSCRIGPIQKEFRLKDQVTSASTSISSNIAEGFEYHNNRQFIRYLTYAKGSVSETFSLLCVIRKAGLMEEYDFGMFSEKLLSLGRKIGGFIQYLERNRPS
jgi:four helix bundle protein